MTTRSCSRKSAAKVSRSTRTGPSGPAWTLRGSASPWIGPCGRCGTSAADAAAKRRAARADTPRRPDRSRRPRAAATARPRRAVPAGEAGTRGRAGRGPGAASSRVPRARRAYGLGQPVPHRHRVAVHHAGLRLGGPYGGNARRGEQAADGQFALGPCQQFRVAAADLDHESSGREHRVLAQCQQFRSGGESGGGQHLACPCLVHGPDSRIRAGRVDEPTARQHDDGGRRGGRTSTSRPKESNP